MSASRSPARIGGRPTTTEFTVAGPLGNVLRAAFADQGVTTEGVSTIIRTGPGTDHDLTDLVRTLVEHGLVVQSVRRLTDR